MKKDVTLLWVRRLRDEVRFAGTEELIRQVDRDREAVREVLRPPDQAP